MIIRNIKESLSEVKSRHKKMYDLHYQGNFDFNKNCGFLYKPIEDGVDSLVKIARLQNEIIDLLEVDILSVRSLHHLNDLKMELRSISRIIGE